MSDEQDAAQEILNKVADVLIVLSDVGAGDYKVRLPSHLPESHPLGALFTGINEMLESLEAEQNRSQIWQRELEEKLAEIEQQRIAIRQLSAPIMEVWEGVLCLAVVGLLDTTRSAEMTDALLRAIVEKKAWCTIVDITGIEIMDTSTADHFIRMAKAVRMLGAECVLTGINPIIAQTIVDMGVDMVGVVTHRSLRDALQHYVGRELEDLEDQ